MKHIFSLLLLFILPLASAEEWEPQWIAVELPGIDADTYYAEARSAVDNGEQLFWIFFIQPKPVQAKYLSGERYLSELQEWVVDCVEKNGSIATIRYSNNSEPKNSWKNFVLVHPDGKESPTSAQVEVICGFNT